MRGWLQAGVALLLAASSLVAVEAAGISTSGAVGLYDNAAIADKALSYVGRWGGEACRDAGKLDNGNTGTTVGGYGGGQCRTFVNCILWMVSSQTQ